MTPEQRAILKVHGAIVATILALLGGYFAFNFFIFGELVDVVLTEYGVGHVPAMLGLGILFLLMLKAFMWLATTVPGRVAEYMTEREGLS